MAALALPESLPGQKRTSAPPKRFAAAYWRLLITPIYVLPVASLPGAGINLPNRSASIFNTFGS
jgi:hypothetical protein